MAFQSGTQVDPRLMQADYSGFTKAAEMEAQGMQNFASGVTQGVKKFAEKRKEKKEEQRGVDAISSFAKSNPSLASAIGLDYTDADGFLDEKLLKKSATDFVKTVGVNKVYDSIIGLQGLAVKSESAATDYNIQKQADAYDPVGYQRLMQAVASNPSYSMDEGQLFFDPDTSLTKFGDKFKVQPGSPQAQPFEGKKGSAFLGLGDFTQREAALQTGGSIPVRPAPAFVPGQIVEQDGIRYQVQEDGSYTPVN